MKQFTDTFCWRPFTDMVIVDKFYKPCCYYSQNLHYKSFDTTNEKIRKDIKENRWNSGCDICRKTEADGNINSHRFKYNDTPDKSLYENNKFNLINLELIVDNNCNLACITCDSHSSSRWAAEKKRMNELDTHNQHTVDLNTVLNIELWKNVQTLTLYGGEPLYSKKVLKILSFVIENNFSKQIELKFYTNGTLFNAEIINLLRHFKKISIGFSIDATHERFNIIRWPAKWDQVLDNYNKIKKVENVETYKIYTYSLLNACYTKSDLQILNEKLSGYTVSNLLINPSYYAARHLPRNIKQKLIAEISEIKDFTSLQSELQQDGEEHQLIAAIAKLKKLDSYRNTDSSILFPQDVWSLADK
jgi:sulfatase maturation enzyme AslB (radical SAM superfamily)